MDSDSKGEGIMTLSSSAADVTQNGRQSILGNLQISVVEGRNFANQETGAGLRPSIELQIGDHKVRTHTLKDTLSLSWLADFNLPVQSEDCLLYVSVIDSDLLLERETLVGKAVVSVSDLLCSGTKVQWIDFKDVEDNGAGQICLVLRYSSCQLHPSSTAASTSSDSRDNQYGLTALLCPTPLSASSIRCDTQDGHADCSVHRGSQELLDDEVATPERARTGVAGSPTTLRSPILQMTSFLEDISCEQAHKFEDDEHERGDVRAAGSADNRKKYTGQHKIAAFAGVLVAIAVAMAWGSSYRRKPQDHEKVDRAQHIQSQGP